MIRTAVVTGTNRGIGREVARSLVAKGLRVVACARDEAKAAEVARWLEAAVPAGGPKPVPFALDVTDFARGAELARFVEEKFGGADVLVNNAGVFLEASQDRGGRSPSAFEIPIDVIRVTLESNTYGAYGLSQRLIPAMRKRRYGRVVNVSSGMGQLTEMNGSYPAYRLSKAALNAVTRIFADETEGENVLVNSVCPGWVKTDMGGPGAERSIEEGADTIVWLATLPEGGPTGGFFRDRKPISW